MNIKTHLQYELLQFAKSIGYELTGEQLKNAEFRLFDEMVSAKIGIIEFIFKLKS